MKKVLALCLLCAMCLSGCKTAGGISNFDGTWRQVNSDSEDSYQEAVIDGDNITIYWMSNGGDSKMLYWTGTFDVPDGRVSKHSWTSISQLDDDVFALLASQDDTKDFKYSDGQITYEKSALGVTTVVRLELVD